MTKLITVDKAITLLIEQLPVLVADGEVSSSNYFKSIGLDDRLDITLQCVLAAFRKSESKLYAEGVVIEIVEDIDPVFNGNRSVIDLLFKRRRGRPTTGDAMSDAEKQRAYRARRNAALEKLEREAEQYRKQLNLEHKKNMELTAEIDSLVDKVAALKGAK